MEEAEQSCIEGCGGFTGTPLPSNPTHPSMQDCSASYILHTNTRSTPLPANPPHPSKQDCSASYIHMPTCVVWQLALGLLFLLDFVVIGFGTLNLSI